MLNASTKVSLHRLTKEDMSRFLDFTKTWRCLDDRVQEWCEEEKPTEEQNQKYWLRSFRDGRFFIFIVLDEKGVYSGVVNVEIITSSKSKNYVGILGYWIRPDIWGNGFGRESVRQAIEFLAMDFLVKNNTDAFTLLAKVKKANEASIRILEGLRFTDSYSDRRFKVYRRTVWKGQP